MNRIVIFSESVSTQIITSAFPMHEPLVVHSKSECAGTLVGEAAIDCLVVQRDIYGPEYQAFLSSIHHHFPLLEIVLIAPGGPTAPPDGCRFLDGSAGDADLAGRIAAVSQAARAADHRHGIRYDWPLVGHLASGGREVSCKVRAFSSSGAFLETDAAAPADTAAEADMAAQADAAAILRIEFLNSQMTVKCEIVRRQEAGATEPGGCGVRFLDLSVPALEFCERIVRDAVVQALLYPEQEKAVPAMTDEDLLIPGYDQM
jgi:hypothetical protein